MRIYALKKVWDRDVVKWKNGYWYPYGYGKRIVNFVIVQVVEI